MIIPTNFSLNKKEFDRKLEILTFSKKIHIDFMDGVFTTLKSTKFNMMEKLNKYNYDVEVHLMCINPIKYLKNILSLNAKKVLIHIEVFKTQEFLIKTLKEFKKKNLKVFLVVDGGNDIKNLFYFTKNLEIKKNISGVMFMGVKCGAQGQKFISSTFSKVKKFKEFYPKIKTEVDGGVNLKNMKKIKENFDIVCVGSSISNSNEPKKSYLELKRI